jgi:PKD repeat protein
MTTWAARPAGHRMFGRRWAALAALVLTLLVAAAAAIPGAASAASSSSLVPGVSGVLDTTSFSGSGPSLGSAASFTFTPQAPKVGQSVTFTDTSTAGTVTSRTWDFGDGTVITGAEATSTITHTYTTAGPFEVTLEVTDEAGILSTPASQTVTVTVNQAPTAAFTMNPPVVAVGDRVTFFSTSTDADGQITAFAWDLDSGGSFNDGLGPSATRVYTTPGIEVIRLQVTDDAGATAIATATLTVVRDEPPIAGFSFSPSTPHAGDAVQFRSTSTDADGSVQRVTWDLDGDGQFDDAAGPTAAWSFATPGAYTVGLTATDDRNVSSIAFQTVQVAPAAASPAPGSLTRAAPASVAAAKAPSALQLRMLAPFPIVRISGTILHGGVRVKILSVRAGARTTVEVGCRGRSCPVRKVVQRARTVARTLRFHTYERRLRAGVVLEIRIMRRGRIGKYTQFRIRGFAAPARRDMCLRWPSRVPSRCPEQ